jgi:hypothetical protein
MAYFQPPTAYDSAEWTQAAATDYDVSAQALFSACKMPSHVVIRCDQTMTIKFNTTTSSSITVAANTAFELDYNFFALFVTTTTSTAIKIVFLQ